MKFTGPANCQIANLGDETKNVHVSQLKIIEKRSYYPSSYRVASKFFYEIPVYSSMLSSIFFKFQYVTKSDFKYIQVCAIFVNTIFQHIPVY